MANRCVRWLGVVLALAPWAAPRSAEASSGIFKSFVIVDTGSGNVFYNLAGGVGTNWDGLNLGSINAATGTLVINGFEVNTFKNGASDVTGAFGNYRFYAVGSTPPSFTERNVPFNANLPTPGDQRWQNTADAQNLMSGPLNAGTTYRVEVFTRASTNIDGNLFMNNGGNNFIATFTVPVSSFTFNGSGGSTSTASNWSVNRTPGTGHDLTFATAATTSVTNTIGSANSLAFASGAGAFTLSGSSTTVGAGGITNSSSNLQTLNQPLVLGAGQSWNTGSAGLTVNGAVSGANNLTKTGAGVLTLTGNNSYSGTTTVANGTLVAAGTSGNRALAGTTAITVNAAGTLALAAGNQINNSATLDLAGGRLNANTSGGSQTTTLGALTLSGSSIIDLAAGVNTTLLFAASNGATWANGATLSIYNWGGTAANGVSLGSGTDVLRFGSGASDLNTGQLAQILFYSDNGVTPLGAATILSDGTVLPVPEPGTVLAGALALGFVAAAAKRRRRAVKGEK